MWSFVPSSSIISNNDVVSQSCILTFMSLNGNVVAMHFLVFFLRESRLHMHTGIEVLSDRQVRFAGFLKYKVLELYS